MSKSAIKTLFAHWVILILTFIQSQAQVINDDIENRIGLNLNEIYSSSTDGCTVQGNCVDESLTGKCIDYHNDQWFTFNSGLNSTLYLNISNQKCRDLRGVQIVVLKGVPCETETYDILTCVSLANQNDIFVELSPIELNMDYLINIDGYLHDFCEFQLEISDFPKGISVDNHDYIDAIQSRSGNEIRIDWSLPDSLQYQIREFQIYKRIHPNFRSEYLETVPVSANAYGEIQNEYFFRDSVLSNNTNYFTLLALRNDDKLDKIGTYKFNYNYSASQPKYLANIKIPIPYCKPKSVFSILVFDYVSMNLISNFTYTYKRNDPKFIEYPTQKAVQNSVYKLYVKIINNENQNMEEHTFDLLLN